MADNDKPEEINTDNAAYERKRRAAPWHREHPTQRSFWHSLDAAEREALAAAAKEQVYWAGTMLCRQDELTTDVILIKSGWVKVTECTNGQEQIIAVQVHRGAERALGRRHAGDVIDVRVRQQDMAHVQAFALYDRQKLGELIARIDENRLARLVAGDDEAVLEERLHGASL